MGWFFAFFLSISTAGGALSLGEEKIDPCPREVQVAFVGEALEVLLMLGVALAGDGEEEGDSGGEQDSDQGGDSNILNRSIGRD